MSVAPDRIHDNDLPPSTVADFGGVNLEGRLKAGHNLFKNVLLGHEKDTLKALGYYDDPIPFITKAIRTIGYGHSTTETGWHFRDPMDSLRNKSSVDLTSAFPGFAEVTVHAGKDGKQPGYSSLSHALDELGADEVAKLWAIDSTFWNPDEMPKVLTAGLEKPRGGIRSEKGTLGFLLKIPRALNLIGLHSTRLEDPLNMITYLDIPGYPAGLKTMRRIQEVPGICIIAGRSIGQLGQGQE